MHIDQSRVCVCLQCAMCIPIAKRSLCLLNSFSCSYQCNAMQCNSKRSVAEDAAKIIPFIAQSKWPVCSTFKYVNKADKEEKAFRSGTGQLGYL